VDTAHGHTKGVIDAVRATKKEFSRRLRDRRKHRDRRSDRSADRRGVDASKSASARAHLHDARRRGIGVPQISAVSDCARVADRFDIPIIADGGVKHSGDITKRSPRARAR